ncbi:hypothetical protein ACUXQ2_006199, partial [Cupriavidus metallidurans]
MHRFYTGLIAPLDVMKEALSSLHKTFMTKCLPTLWVSRTIRPLATRNALQTQQRQGLRG